jgi:hypothetical protein
MDPTTLDKLQQILGPSAQTVIAAAITQVYIDGILSIILLLISAPFLLFIPKMVKRVRAEFGEDNFDQSEGLIITNIVLIAVIGVVVFCLLLNALILGPRMLNPNFWAYKSLLP